MAPSTLGRPRDGTLAVFVRVALLCLALVVAASACGSISMTAPPATPTDFPGLAGRFNAAGVEVSDWVSGDAGCIDPDLVPTAISFDARGLDQPSDARIHLYVFRNRASFERLRDRVGPCAAAFVTDATTYEEIQQSPYVVAGQGPWAPQFESAIRRTLEQAAGTGG